MEIIKIKDEYIKLGQALKLAGFVDSGLEAKDAVINGSVKGNSAGERNCIMEISWNTAETNCR